MPLLLNQLTWQNLPEGGYDEKSPNSAGNIG